MDIENIYVQPREDLDPDWVEVQMVAFRDGDSTYEVILSPGQLFQIGGITFEPIEQSMGGSPVLCRVVRDVPESAILTGFMPINNAEIALQLLRKYGQERRPLRLPEWLRRRFKWF